MAARLWFDVQDLFEYAHSNGRPSGVQRLAFEVYRDLQARYGATGSVCFVRHSRRGNEFQVVQWPEIAALFSGLSSGGTIPVKRAAAGPILARLPGRRFIRKLAYGIAPSLLPYIVDACRMQARAARAWVRLIAATARAASQALRGISGRLSKLKTGQSRSARTSPGRFSDLAAPGDFLVMFGSTWFHPDYSRLVSRQKARGLRFAVLIYDLIPLRRPEWFNRVHIDPFRVWMESVVPLSDKVFAISCATALDLETYAREQGMVLPGRVATLPIGSELQRTMAVRTKRLPPPATYGLMVSTIEARKNHLLLFRVWDRLLKELPREAVPTLVFAGRVGNLVADLMQQIANTDYLAGKLVVIESPSDPELAALYEGCLFTLFPSLFEGWGLPVTESLAFGKPCLIADRTSLPEAGGSLVKSFDPDNLHDAYRVIRCVIEDRAGLEQWEAQVQREFELTPWSATVDALLAELGHPFGNPSDGTRQSNTTKIFPIPERVI